MDTHFTSVNINLAQSVRERLRSNDGVGKMIVELRTEHEEHPDNRRGTMLLFRSRAREVRGIMVFLRDTWVEVDEEEQKLRNDENGYLTAVQARVLSDEEGEPSVVVYGIARRDVVTCELEAKGDITMWTEIIVVMEMLARSNIIEWGVLYHFDKSFTEQSYIP